MSEYIIQEKSLKELADIVRNKFLDDNQIIELVANRKKFNITSLLEGVTIIGDDAFHGCTNLALTSLPEGVTSIGHEAFSSCHNLALTSIPEGITSIGRMAFFNCINLTSLTFKGTPTTIESNAFMYCDNLTTINVPWVEGAVAGAPWGATNATINYNYTGGIV